MAANPIDQLLAKIVDKQFEMIAESFRFKDIPEGGMIEVTIDKKKKMMPWYSVFHFRSEEQYNEWKAWAIEELKKEDREKDFLSIDFIFGMNFPIKPLEKGSQLSLIM